MGKTCSSRLSRPGTGGLPPQTFSGDGGAMESSSWQLRCRSHQEVGRKPRNHDDMNWDKTGRKDLIPAEDLIHFLDVLHCSLFTCFAVIFDCLAVLDDRKQNQLQADAAYTHQMLREETAELKLMARSTTAVLIVKKLVEFRSSRLDVQSAVDQFCLYASGKTSELLPVEASGVSATGRPSFILARFICFYILFTTTVIYDLFTPMQIFFWNLVSFMAAIGEIAKSYGKIIVNFHRIDDKNLTLLLSLLQKCVFQEM